MKTFTLAQLTLTAPVVLAAGTARYVLEKECPAGSHHVQDEAECLKAVKIIEEQGTIDFWGNEFQWGHQTIHGGQCYATHQFIYFGLGPSDVPPKGVIRTDEVRHGRNWNQNDQSFRVCKEGDPVPSLTTVEAPTEVTFADTQITVDQSCPVDFVVGTTGEAALTTRVAALAAARGVTLGARPAHSGTGFITAVIEDTLESGVEPKRACRTQLRCATDYEKLVDTVEDAVSKLEGGAKSAQIADLAEHVPLHSYTASSSTGGTTAIKTGGTTWVIPARATLTMSCAKLDAAFKGLINEVARVSDANLCRCDNGVYATGPSCHTHGANVCVSCHSGYTLSGSTCKVSNQLETPHGWTCTARKDICYKSMPASNHHHAINECKQLGARVCEHNDMMELCGAGFNPYNAGVHGWYGDHGTATAGGNNWDDEYGTWNRNKCDNNNDGPAQDAGDSLPYNCCKMGDMSSGDDGCPSNLSTIKTSNGEICAGVLESPASMHAAIDVCKLKKAHVCTHNDMMQLAFYGNPWAGSQTGWYGDHGTAVDGDWDNEFGTWNVDNYSSNNDGVAHDQAHSFHFRCCGTGKHLNSCPSGFSVHNGICYHNPGGAKNMHDALETCHKLKSHVCEHNDMQQICASGFDPYTGNADGWYGDHGKAPGGNWDDEYGSWNRGNCVNDNDGKARAYSDSLAFRCCTAATTATTA